MRLLNWTLIILFALSAIVLTACDCNTPDEDDVGELLGEWYLSNDDTHEPQLSHLVDLEVALSEYGLSVGYPEDAAYRFGWVGDEEEYWEWIARADANLAGLLHPVDSVYPGEEGLTLYTHGGLEEDSLRLEVEDSKLWLENLLGTSILSFAYPTHVHDEAALREVKDAGYLVARNGLISFEPWGSHLLGMPDDAAWDQGWERTSPYELPLTFTAAEVQALEPSQIADWLADPSRLETWKSEHRWVHLYTRTDSEDQTSVDIIDANRLGVLLDALQADGEVWIAPMGEVAIWALGNGQSNDPANDLLWRADAAGDFPWNGNACVFSFSTDDGFASNMDHYLPEFSSRGLSYTAFCSPEKIQIGDTGYELYLDSQGVQALAAAGVEIGCNGMTRRYLISSEACVIKDEAGEGYHIEIVTEEGHRKLKLWRDW